VPRSLAPWVSVFWVSHFSPPQLCVHEALTGGQEPIVCKTLRPPVRSSLARDTHFTRGIHAFNTLLGLGTHMGPMKSKNRGMRCGPSPTRHTPHQHRLFKDQRVIASGRGPQGPGERTVWEYKCRQDRETHMTHTLDTHCYAPLRFGMHFDAILPMAWVHVIYTSRLKLPTCRPVGE
jgi:hypothetical protein